MFEARIGQRYWRYSENVTIREAKSPIRVKPLRQAAQSLAVFALIMALRKWWWWKSPAWTKKAVQPDGRQSAERVRVSNSPGGTCRLPQTGGVIAGYHRFSPIRTSS
jgi:hypothetical protein